jgi:O-antigen/teichoic acid export membrane protein
MMLNYMLPGAAGAAAGGYYSVARKLASALQVVRLAFEYVMAPLAAEKDGKGDKHRLEKMYAFATRMSLCMALPFGAALYLARPDILSALEHGFQAAATAIAILVAGRVLEAASGPSQSIIEMLGHRLLPPLNGLIGLLVFVYLGWILIPEHGVTGAAIAAATGLNITAYLAFAQTAFIFKLWPYTSETLKPVLVSLISATALVAMAECGPKLPAPAGLITAIIGLIVALLVLVRYGLKPNDVAALGKPGRWLSRGPK